MFRGNKFKFILSILIILLLTFCFNHYSYSQIRFINRQIIKDVDLKSGYAYAQFNSNNNFLVWMEDYTGKLFIYKINEKKLIAKRLIKGRGPHEYSVVQSLCIANNKIILDDPKNIKFIVYDIDKKKFQKDIKIINFDPSHISSNEHVIFFVNSGGFADASSLFGIMDLNKNKFNEIDMKQYKLNKEFAYVFKREGWVTSNNEYGIFLSLYYPKIYVIDINHKSIQKRILFDQSETKRGVTIDTGNGNHLYGAPTDYDIKDKDVAFVPGMKHSIFILAKGKGYQRSYKTNELRVFDFKKEKFTQTIDLGVKAEYITVNDNYLYAYSKDQNKIYQYKIVHKK